MPLKSTTKKYVELLTDLKKDLNGSVHTSLSSMLSKKAIPTEYVGIFIKNGIILKTDGGLRGRSAYKWNPKAEINEQTVNRCIRDFNLKKSEAIRAKKVEKETIMQRLDKLESMVQEVLNKIKNN